MTAQAQSRTGRSRRGAQHRRDPGGGPSAGAECRLLKPIEEAEYARFVDRHPDALFHHRPEWRDLLVRSLGVAPRTLVARRAGRIVGALPLLELSTPVRGRRLLAAPLCRNLPVLADSGATRAGLVSAAAALGREQGCASVELRCGEPFPTGSQFTERREFLNFTVDLTVGEEALWARCHPRSVRQAVRRARRDGVGIEQAAPGEQAAYRRAHQLALATRRRQGAPPLPREFFEALADLSVQTRRVRLFIARWRGRDLAAGIVLRHGRIAHLFDAVSTDERPLLRKRPNHAVLWAALCAALADGCTMFDLGPNHRLNQGLSAYKSYWAAEQRAVPHHFLPLTDPRVYSAEIQNPTYRLARVALRGLPRFLYARLWSGLALEAY